MKYLLKIIGVFIAVTIVMAFTTPEKQVSKLVARIWKDKEVSMEKISIPDSLVTDLNSLDRLMSEGEAIGFAVHATAYGCRVGGCPAPSGQRTQANSQSYETFDYIVIYDKNLMIKKIDIANYGGEYGYEICRAKWLKQFSGSRSGFELGENIDGITGATVSASYLIEDLNSLSAILQKIGL
ncbi:MAG: hypothetical protein ACI837_001567 [Crocinitomicaceae bacterium]|jgi:hypothetical protein